MNNDIILHNRIKEARQEKKLSQEESFLYMRVFAQYLVPERETWLGEMPVTGGKE